MGNEGHAPGNRVGHGKGVESTSNRLERSVNRVVLHEETRRFLDGGRPAAAHPFLERFHG